jgi:hypothetical protein
MSQGTDLKELVIPSILATSPASIDMEVNRNDEVFINIRGN